MRAVDELQALQEERKVLFFFCPILLFGIIFYFIYLFSAIFFIFQKVDPETAEAIDQFLVKLQACAAAKSSFTFILDDPAGNSSIENP